MEHETTDQEDHPKPQNRILIKAFYLFGGLVAFLFLLTLVISSPFVVNRVMPYLNEEVNARFPVEVVLQDYNINLFGDITLKGTKVKFAGPALLVEAKLNSFTLEYSLWQLIYHRTISIQKMDLNRSLISLKIKKNKSEKKPASAEDLQKQIAQVMGVLIAPPVALGIEELSMKRVILDLKWSGEGVRLSSLLSLDADFQFSLGPSSAIGKALVEINKGGPGPIEIHVEREGFQGSFKAKFTDIIYKSSITMNSFLPAYLDVVMSDLEWSGQLLDGEITNQQPNQQLDLQFAKAQMSFKGKSAFLANLKQPMATKLTQLEGQVELQADAFDLGLNQKAQQLSLDLDHKTLFRFRLPRKILLDQFDWMEVTSSHDTKLNHLRLNIKDQKPLLVQGKSEVLINSADRILNTHISQNWSIDGGVFQKPFQLGVFLGNRVFTTNEYSDLKMGLKLNGNEFFSVNIDGWYDSRGSRMESAIRFKNSSELMSLLGLDSKENAALSVLASSELEVSEDIFKVEPKAWSIKLINIIQTNGLDSIASLPIKLAVEKKGETISGDLIAHLKDLKPLKDIGPDLQLEHSFNLKLDPLDATMLTLIKPLSKGKLLRFENPISIRQKAHLQQGLKDKLITHSAQISIPDLWTEKARLYGLSVDVTNQAILDNSKKISSSLNWELDRFRVQFNDRFYNLAQAINQGQALVNLTQSDQELQLNQVKLAMPAGTLRLQGKTLKQTAEGKYTAKSWLNLDQIGKIPNLIAKGSMELDVEAYQFSKKGFTVRMKPQCNNITLQTADYGIEGLKGGFKAEERIVWDEKGLHFEPLVDIEAFRRVDYEKVEPYLQGAAGLEVGQIRYKDLAIGPIGAKISLNQNFMLISRYDMEVLGGIVGGKSYLDLTPGLFRFGLVSRLGALDLSLLSSNKQPQKELLSLRSSIDYSFSRNTLDGRLDVTEIGGPQLRRLINVMDPEGENSSLQKLKSALKISAPTYVGIEFKQGFMSLICKMSNLPTIEVPHIGINQLLQKHLYELVMAMAPGMLTQKKGDL